MAHPLAAIFEDGTIRVDYSTPDFESAVRGLLNSPLRARGIEERGVDAIVESVLRRESAGTTSAGPIAFPHARVPALPTIVAGLGINREGIHPNGETQVMVAFVSPLEAAGDHLRFLSAAAKTFRDAAFLQRVLGAHTREEILELFAAGPTAAGPPSR